MRDDLANPEAKWRTSDYKYVIERLAGQFDIPKSRAEEVYNQASGNYELTIRVLKDEKEWKEEEDRRRRAVGFQQNLHRFAWRTKILPEIQRFFNNPALNPMERTPDALIILQQLVEKGYFVEFRPVYRMDTGEYLFTECHLYRLSGVVDIHMDGADAWEALIFATWRLIVEKKESYG